MDKLLFLLIIAFTFSNCANNSHTDAPDAQVQEQEVEVEKNKDFTLPAGFSATVFAESIGSARHLIIDENERVFVNLRSLNQGYGNVTLVDTNNDGRADLQEFWGDEAGTGMDIYDGNLYFSSDDKVYSVPVPPRGELVPALEKKKTLVTLPQQTSHAAKPVAVAPNRGIFVNVGAPSNACQKQSRTAGSPGMDPCPLLKEQGGIWVYDLDKTNQRHSIENRYVSGLRNVVALEYHSVFDALYAVQHGRDQLNTLWPEHFTDKQNAELPAEVFYRLENKEQYAWPYCYYDPEAEEFKLSPEYGGDGQITGRCDTFPDPLMDFPAHLAPNDLLFYTGDQFPAHYRNGAFIAFHGSWNRAPLPQKGYFVAFIPMEDGVPAGDWEIFADHFAGPEGVVIESPKDAKYRPMGLAQTPDGSLMIADSQKGRLWKITYDQR